MTATKPPSLIDYLATYYDAVGADYDDWSSGIHRRISARLVEIAEPHPGECVLDVGCGTGLVTHLVANQVGDRGTVVGIDISERLLDMARSRAGRQTSFVRMPAGRLRFPGATYDVVTMGDCLGFLPDPGAALGEARRVLKPGGRIAVSCRRRSLATPAQELYMDLLHGLERCHPVSVPAMPDERGLLGEPEPLERMITNNGFSDVTMTSMVTGGQARDARDWTELMMGAGLLQHALVSVLGPQLRERFEAELARAMAPLGDGAYRYHHGYTLGVGFRA